MTVKYIQFIPGVSLSIGTRNCTSMNGYAFEKHAKEVDVEESAAEVSFYIKGPDGKRTGDRIRMPRTAIASIRETVDVPKGKAS